MVHSAVEADVEVLIVGGGPVGLTARVLLQRWGVTTLLVEKRRELSPFPRSRLVNTRTMEIFRQIGLADQVAARAFAPEFGRIRFRDTLRDHDFATAAMVGINEPIAESPVIGAVTSQDRLEPTLLAGADSPARFGVELVDLREEPGSVLASLVDQTGERFSLRARCVLAADGANSTVRELLGINTTGPGALLDVSTVVFEADLQRWCETQPAGVYFTMHGTFTPLYPEGGWAWFAPTPGNVEDADWAGVVAGAIGAAAETEAESDLKVDVLRVQHWTMTAFVADRLRHGRILLAGDAAHTVPIIGGLGMNAGIADVHNLCWKLAGVLRGWAGPTVLETYEAERHPAARRTLRQAVANAQLMMQVTNRRQEQRAAGSAEIELPWSERYFAQLGLVLGVSYQSDAVLTEDGAAPETAEPEPGPDYLPAARPGHRMPHSWLAANRSTLDALGEWFTLLTPDPAGWAQSGPNPCPLRLETLPREHTDLFGLGPHGALLIRPDGHVAARWPDHPRGDSTVRHALAAVTHSATN
jgi:2-polyprenyl-6-methoxyphenol hydroxylase-like FAD-dependent oxidoreductase